MSEVLEPAECVLDQVTVAIAGPVVSNRSFAGDAPRYDRHGARLWEGTAQGVGVISLVGEHVAGALGPLQEFGRDRDVGDVSWGELQRERSADAEL